MSIIKNKYESTTLTYPQVNPKYKKLHSFNLLFIKITLDLIVSLITFGVSDEIRQLKDLIILAATIVILNTILVIIWTLIKMFLKIIKRKLELKISKSKDEKVKEIMKTASKEIDDHIDKTDKIIDKITEKNIKNSKKEWKWRVGEGFKPLYKPFYFLML